MADARRGMVKAVFGGLIVLVLVLLAAFAVVALKTANQRAPSREVVKPSKALVERGAYLTKHVLACLGCHSKRDWNRFGAPIVGHPGSGGSCFNEKWGMPGLVCPPNLTPNKEVGLGSWTDGEIVRAMREGVDRHGEALFPFMPYATYRTLADDDARAVVAFLRSLKPRPNRGDRTKLGLLTHYSIQDLPQPLEGPVHAPDRSNAARYGEYLATVSGCHHCHTPTDDEMQPIEDQAFAGGREFKAPFGTFFSSNITPHQTGIGKWERATFVRRFLEYRAKGADKPVKPALNTPMPWLEYAGMTEDDLGAIFEYLKTVSPVENRVVIRPGR